MSTIWRRAAYPPSLSESRKDQLVVGRGLRLTPSLLASVALLFSVGVIMGTALALYLLETDPPVPPVDGRDPVLSDAGPASDAEITAISNALLSASLGDHEIATATLSALSNEAGEVARREALFLLARTQYEWGDPAAATDSLDRYLAAYPTGPDSDRAALLRASALSQLGDSAGAIGSLEQYLSTAGPVDNYAASRLGDLQLEAGDRLAARAAYLKALGQPLPSYTNVDILLKLADLEWTTGDGRSALAWAERAFVMSPSTADRVAALRLVSDYANAIGDERRWREALVTLVEQFPQHREATTAMAELDTSGIFIGDLTRAKLLLAHGDVSGAEGYLLAALTAGSRQDGAEAAYTLGILREAAGEFEAALAWYEQSAPPESAPVALELAVRQRVVRLQLGHDGAAQDLEDYVEDHPATVFSLAALKALADHAAAAGDDHAAADYLVAAAASASTLPDDSEAVELAAAAAELYDEIGESESARRAVTLAVTLDPSSYRAVALQVSGLGNDNPGDPQLPATYSARTSRDWLGDYVGILPPSAPSASGATATARELWALGLRSESRSMQRQAISEARYAPILLLNIALQTANDGDFASSARAGDALLSRLPVDLRSGIARSVAELAYPRPYNQEVGDVSDEFDIDPLLLYGLIRQESFFDPTAISSARARGLTQVITPTAQAIAADLGQEGFVEQDLYRPRISLRFGAYYLGAQMETFGVDYAALAAYNGGPGNAERWQTGVSRETSSLAAFLARVDFAETSAYVRLVLEHYANYRAIYLGAENPVLPSD